jgi:anti-anti-sigma factor
MMRNLAAEDMRVLSWTGSFGTYVKVLGDIDLCSASAFRDYLDGLADRGCRDLVIDLGEHPLFGSEVLGVLTSITRRLAPAGQLRLVTPSVTVRKVLDATGMSDAFPVHLSLGDAIVSLKRASLPALASRDAAEMAALRARWDIEQLTPLVPGH